MCHKPRGRLQWRWRNIGRCRPSQVALSTWYFHIVLGAHPALAWQCESLSIRPGSSPAAHVSKETGSGGAVGQHPHPRKHGRNACPSPAPTALMGECLNRTRPGQPWRKTSSYRFPVKGKLEKPGRVWVLRPSKGFPGWQPHPCPGYSREPAHSPGAPSQPCSATLLC